MVAKPGEVSLHHLLIRRSLIVMGPSLLVAVKVLSGWALAISYELLRVADDEVGCTFARSASGCLIIRLLF